VDRKRLGEAQLSDIEILFSSQDSTLAGLPCTDCEAIRNVLLRRRDQLGVWTVPAGTGRSARSMPVVAGHLYGALSYPVEILFENVAGRRVTIDTAETGKTFGEMQWSFSDSCETDLGLQMQASAPISKPTRVLDCPKAIVHELRQIPGFEAKMSGSAISDLRELWIIASHRMTQDLALLLAHLAVSPRCGRNAIPHDSLRYCGNAVTTSKDTSLAELSQLSGMAMGSVRFWLARLERAGYLQATRKRGSGTFLEVLDPERLVQGLTERHLTI
jgi:DNA-binding transcriptional ArsR family regulator